MDSSRIVSSLSFSFSFFLSPSIAKYVLMDALNFYFVLKRRGFLVELSLSLLSPIIRCNSWGIFRNALMVFAILCNSSWPTLEVSKIVGWSIHVRLSLPFYLSILKLAYRTWEYVSSRNRIMGLFLNFDSFSCYFIFFSEISHHPYWYFQSVSGTQKATLSRFREFQFSKEIGHKFNDNIKMSDDGTYFLLPTEIYQSMMQPLARANP